MIDINTFKKDISEISNNMNKKGEYSIEVTLTDECNFKCLYCFEGNNCLKNTTLNCVEDIFKSIDIMLMDDWFMDTFSGIRIGFWGGEPTLRPNIIRLFAERFKKNDLIKFHIYTNGYNINELMDIFKGCKDKINIQVSYDGKRINDIKRVLRSNKETTARVRNNIYKLCENGFIVSLKSTVTHDTLEYMVDSWEDIQQINNDLGDNIKYNITIDYINPVDIDLDVVRKSFISVAKKELLFYKNKGYHLLTWFSSNRPVICDFFKHGMAINTNGDMLYCHGCGYSTSIDDFCFGNISDGDFLEKIKYNHGFFNAPEIKECRECISVNCVTCNVIKYDNSEKEGFFEKWYDLPCQKSQCDIFREFSKVSISLKDIIGGKNGL